VSGVRVIIPNLERGGAHTTVFKFQ